MFDYKTVTIPLTHTINYDLKIELVQGENQLTINKNELTPGIYFVNISNGVSTITKKVILSK